MRHRCHRRRYTSALIIAMLLPFTACKQNVQLPNAGADEASVRRVLGSPTAIERGANLNASFYVRTIDGCGGIDSARMAEAWLYRGGTLHRTVFVAFDSSKHVLCAGHGGVSWSHQ